MAARKSRPAKAAPPRAAATPPRFAGRVSVVADLAEARAKIAQLDAALEAEHNLAGERAAEKAKLEEQFEQFKHSYLDALRKDFETLAYKEEVDRLQAQIAAFRESADTDADTVKRLRRELVETNGDLRMHRLRDERAHTALPALALLLADMAAELRERDDDEAMTIGRQEARNV